jgi:hypothetical protein
MLEVGSVQEKSTKNVLVSSLETRAHFSFRAF